MGVAPPGTLSPRCIQPRTPSGDIQPAQHHGAVLGTLLWMQADREQSHFTGCQGAVAEGPKLPGVGSWSRKVALPQRDAWGQPGEGAQGFPPGRQHKGLGGGEGSLGGGGRDQHTDRERWQGLWQPPEAGAQKSALGTLQSSKAGAAVPWSEGAPDRAWTWCGRRGFGQWAGLGPDRPCFPALSGPGQWL